MTSSANECRETTKTRGRALFASDLEGRHMQRLRGSAEPTDIRLGPDRIRVLVAEDDPALREMLAEELSDAGYLVTTVENGRDLLSYVKHADAPPQRLKPDLVVSDIRMPGLSGMDVLESLRDSDWATPVILVTAFGDPETHEEARRLGAAHVFNKPFDIDDLVATARDIVPPSL